MSRFEAGIRAATVIMLMGVAGCASTNMSSVVDPAFRGQQLSSVVVAAPSLRLSERQIAETEMQKEFAALGVAAARWIDLLPPTRSGNDQEAAKALASSNAQAVLIFQPGGRSLSQEYVSTPMQTQTTGTINQFGNAYNFNAMSTTTGGGEIVSRPNASDRFVLIALPSAAIAWQADAQSAGTNTLRSMT